jgi:hypothetical protein
MPGGAPWPRISVVTPSYNQAAYLEETMRSVLLQGYPNLEYMVVDGGSTDGSADIIRRYAPYLTYWVCEPDRGQSHAINKGWARATGDLLAWLNSDDTYLPGALATVARYMAGAPACGLCHGGERTVGADSQPLAVAKRHPAGEGLALLLPYNRIAQPTVFVRRALQARVGPLDENLHYVLDRDYWLRASLSETFGRVDAEIATCRIHSAAKTYTACDRQLGELKQVLDRFFGSPGAPPSSSRIARRAHSHLCLRLGLLRSQQGKPASMVRAWARALWLCPAVVADRDHRGQPVLGWLPGALRALTERRGRRRAR